MLQKNYIKYFLIVALFILALGGLLMHSAYHPVSMNGANYIPLFQGLLSLIVIPALFMFSRTTSYGYVLNGIDVIIGTILMAHFSYAHLPKEITLGSLIMKTNFPVILILWAKFGVGKALFHLEALTSLDAKHSGIWWRYPNMFYWCVHLIGLSAVYYFGHILWR